VGHSGALSVYPPQRVQLIALALIATLLKTSRSISHDLMSNDAGSQRLVLRLVTPLEECVSAKLDV
jgi:hypothetical protein